ncbi:hypothetical protein IT401_01465 [Candidatus Nomurabacteria bacterium]|nr:hypothetical protein [Candidatus Nomurabacteria bacterium]
MRNITFLYFSRKDISVEDDDVRDILGTIPDATVHIAEVVFRKQFFRSTKPIDVLILSKEIVNKKIISVLKRVIRALPHQKQPVIFSLSDKNLKRSRRKSLIDAQFKSLEDVAKFLTAP